MFHDPPPPPPSPPDRSSPVLCIVISNETPAPPVEQRIARLVAEYGAYGTGPEWTGRRFAVLQELTEARIEAAARRREEQR